MGLVLEADQLGVGMCVVPEVQAVVDASPGVVDLGEEAHLRRELGAIVAVEDPLGYGVQVDPVEGRPRRIAVLDIVFGGCAS